MIELASLGLDRVMTHQAVLQRNMATKDTYGARSEDDWEPLATSNCFLWWGTGAVISRQGSVHERPEETVDIEIGGMILPAGTDITPHDRVQSVQDDEGNQLAGVLEILSVGPFEGVAELMVRRVT